MLVEDRYYSAKEILKVIKDGWRKSPEEIKELVEFIEGVKMKPTEKYKIIYSDESALLYSAYGMYY